MPISSSIPDEVGTNPNAKMAKLLLPLSLPLKVRGIKGVISITLLAPLILRGEWFT